MLDSKQRFPSLKHPSVSVVIPACNEGQWVFRTVESVLQRSGDFPLDIIVVDDGSADGSCDFVRGKFRGDDRVRVIKDKDLGSAGARGRGAAEAGGDILVFLDAHVIPDPGWLDHLADLLRDPTIGLAGLAVHSIQDPSAIGYVYRFMDEKLTPGWLTQRRKLPVEAPCISGCCCAIPRDLYREIGGFDPGYLGYGTEDIELSLRVWFLGYRCVVSPCARVAHHFKTNRDQEEPHQHGYTWENYDFNLLRCIFTYFSGSRRQAMLTAMQGRDSYHRALARLKADTAFWQQRDNLQRRFSYDEHRYFQKFASELEPFETRIQQILEEKGDSMETTMKRHEFICPQCGAENIGVQTFCLVCRAEYSVPEEQESPRGAREIKQVFCTNCGAPQDPDAAFCDSCGDKLE